jgi:hypothetical protein
MESGSVRSRSEESFADEFEQALGGRFDRVEDIFVPVVEGGSVSRDLRNASAATRTKLEHKFARLRIHIEKCYT